MKKRSQLQIIQTIFALFIIFVLLTIGFIFLIGRQSSAMKTQLEQSLILTNYKKAQVINLLPELQCIRQKVIIRDCYDKLAINSFMKNVNEHEFYYKTLLGNSKIIIIEYLPTGGWETILLYDNPIENYKSIKKYHLPSLIFYPEEKINNFGVIEIEIYN